MGAQPVQFQKQRSLPDYLPARMLHEYAYCPRLFFYEWVEGLFQTASTPRPRSAHLPSGLLIGTPGASAPTPENGVLEVQCAGVQDADRCVHSTRLWRGLHFPPQPNSINLVAD